MDNNREKATKVAKAIMPIMSKSLEALATAIAEKYGEVVKTLAEENDKLAKRIEQMSEEHSQTLADKEQRIAQLTDALAKAGKGAPVPVPEQPKDEQPKGNKKYGKDAVKHVEFDKIKRCVQKNRPVYLCGPAGTGKTQLCEMIAESLDIDFYMTAKVDDKFGIEGFMDAHGKYNDTPFYKAMKHGGMFMFDEMDASDSNAILAVNAAIANRYYAFPNGELVQAHKDFRVIGCGNTFGTGADDQYTGRSPLDASTIDRFIYIFVDYDERVELACAKGNRDIVQFVHDLRKAMAKSRIQPFTISYRGIINLVETEEMFGTADAVQMSITKGLDTDNVNILFENMVYKSNKYAMAFHKSATAYADAA